MRISVLTSLYPSPPRPLEGVFAERRWQGMSARGHEVSVTNPVPLAPGPLSFGRWEEIHRMPAYEDRGGVPVARPRYFHLPRRPRGNARRFARVGTHHVRGGEPDVCVIDYAWPAAAAAPKLAGLGIPCVINGRGSDVLQVAGEAGLGDDLARYLRAAGHWCAVSEDLVRTMDRLAGGAGHGTLVPNGVDMELFRPMNRDAARDALGLPRGVPLVLVVGHLIERKDPLFALRVFEAGAPPEAICVFVGRGPLRAALQARARGNGLGSRVRLAGEVEPGGLARWYAAADALLLTSHREGRPNVVIEALASGRPVLATDVGGTGELLEAWSEPMLAADHDVARMGAMLGELLAGPPAPDELRRSVLNLSWEASMQALEGVLRQAVGSPS